MRKSREKNKKLQKETPHNMPFPSLRIDCYGKGTNVYLDGMEITSGILELNFKAVSMNKEEPPVLDLKLHPHAVTLRRVRKERIETTNSTERHSLIEKKA